MSWQQSEAPKEELWRQEQAEKSMGQSLGKIAGAFIKAKKQFAPAMKTSTNPHFKSKYADLAACVEAVDDAFLDNGIVMYQETFECDNGVTVETVLMHESGEVLRCGKLHVPASKQDAQGYGSALSYARRYSLMAACGIAPEDDDGNAAKPPARPAPPPQRSAPRSIAPALVTMTQIQELMKALKVAGIEESAMLARANIKHLRELEAAKFKGALSWIKSQALGEQQ